MKTEETFFRIMERWTCFSIIFICLLILLAGCYAGPPKTKGGRIDAHAGTLEAGEDPKQPSAMKTSRKIVWEWAPMAAPVPEFPPPDAFWTAVNTSGPAAVKYTLEEDAEAKLGGSWRDELRDYAAKALSMRPVMYLGLLLLVGGPIVAIKSGWPGMAIPAGLSGVAMIALAHFLPQVNPYLGLSILFLMGGGIVFGHYKTKADEAERKEQNEQT